MSVALNNLGAITVQPGPVLQINGSLTTSGTLNMELGGTVAGTGYSQVTVSGGTATLGGALTFSLSFTPPAAFPFTILTSASQSGTFATVNPPGGGWGVAYPANTVVLTAP